LAILTNRKTFISRIQPFVNYTYNDFKYSTYFKANGDKANVVGVPKTKISVGLDFETNIGLYWQNTYNYMGSVYTDFTNSNKVKSFGLLNSKIGYKQVSTSGTWMYSSLETTLPARSITPSFSMETASMILIEDNQYNNTSIYTDVNPGPSKAYFFTGFNLKYNF
jgi:iron complex outermembrane receptor protein